MKLQKIEKELKKGVDKGKVLRYNVLRKGKGVFEWFGSEALFLLFREKGGRIAYG